MTNAPLLVSVNSSVSPTDCGTPGTSYQVINYDDTNTVWIGDSLSVKTGVGIPVQPGASVTVTYPHLYAILDNAATGPVVVIVGTGIADWGRGNITISGPVNATFSGPVEISEIDSVVLTQSDAQTLYTQTIPTLGGNMVSLTNVPPWVRALYVMCDGGTDMQLTLTGGNTGIIYTGSGLGIGGNAPALQAIPYAGVIDSVASVLVSNPTHEVGAKLYFIAVPDAGLLPVQSNPFEPLTVATGLTPLDVNITNAPTQATILAAATTLVSTTAATIIAGTAGKTIHLFSVLVENAGSATAVVTIQSTSGMRIQSMDIGNGVNYQNQYYGAPLPLADGVQIVATGTALPSNMRWSIAYALV